MDRLAKQGQKKACLFPEMAGPEDLANAVHTGTRPNERLRSQLLTPALPTQKFTSCAPSSARGALSSSSRRSKQHKPVVMSAGAAMRWIQSTLTSSLMRLYKNVDIRQATCSLEADRKRILGRVAAGVGFRAVNSLARGCIVGASAAMRHPAVLRAALGDWSYLSKLQPSSIRRRSSQRRPVASWGRFERCLRSACHRMWKHKKASFLPGSRSTAAKQGTPLIAAARGGHLEAVEALLLAGAPVDSIDIWRQHSDDLGCIRWSL